MSESNRAGPIPPYGVAIHEAIRSGDVGAMKKVAEEAKAYITHAKEVEAALEKLTAEIHKSSR